MSLFGKLAVGIFAAGRLEQFLKQSMAAAAEHDKQLGKSMTRLSDAFYTAQVRIGEAVLGNQGVVVAIESIAEAMGLLATVGTQPLKVWEVAWKSTLATIGFGIAKFLQLAGKIPGLGKLAELGEAGEVTALRAFDDIAGIRSAIKGPTRRRPTKGGAAGRGARPLPVDTGVLTADILVPNADVVGLRTAPEDVVRQYLQDLTESIPGVVDEQADAIRDAFGDSLGLAFADGLALGFQRLFESGSIAEGFNAMAGALLGGLGSAVSQFGQAALMTSTLMAKLKAALASLNPAAGAAAAVGLIALGEGLRVAAGAAFGTSGRTMNYATAGVRSTFSGGSEAFSQRGTVVIEVPRNAVARVDDPWWQQFITSTVAAAQGRRVQIRPR